MEKEFIFNFIKHHKLAVISTLGNDKPEAALVGIAVSDELEIIFDTVTSSRKYRNLLQNANVAMVIGWDNEKTIQYEGIAVTLTGADAEKYKELYFGVFPDGRQRAETWDGIVHFKVSPKWIRYSNFGEPQVIEEMKF